MMNFCKDADASANDGAPFFSVELTDAAEPLPLLQVERRYVARVLEHCDGRRTVAAAALGISYPTFLKRLRELGFEQASSAPPTKKERRSFA